MDEFNQDDDDAGQLAESVIRVHDKSPQFRQMMSESAPRLHLKIRIIRAQRLLFVAIPILLASIGLIFFAESHWMAVGIGGLVASLLHLVYLARLVRKEATMGR